MEDEATTSSRPRSQRQILLELHAARQTLKVVEDDASNSSGVPAFTSIPDDDLQEPADLVVLQRVGSCHFFICPSGFTKGSNCSPWSPLRTGAGRDRRDKSREAVR